MTNRTALGLETLERRDTPSTTPLAPGLLLSVSHVDHLVDHFDARADHILKDVATDLSKSDSPAAGLAKLDHLADKLGSRVDHIIKDVFADVHPTGSLKSDLNAISSQTHAFEKTVDAELKAIHADLAAKKSATADLAKLGKTIDQFDAAIDKDVKAIRTDLGTLKLDIAWFKASTDTKAATFDAKADTLLKEVLTDLSKGKGLTGELAKLDHLADHLGHQIRLGIDVVLADGAGTKAEQAELKAIHQLTASFEKTVDEEIQAIRTDVAKKVSATADVQHLQKTVDQYVQALTKDVKAIP